MKEGLCSYDTIQSNEIEDILYWFPNESTLITSELWRELSVKTSRKYIKDEFHNLHEWEIDSALKCLDNKDLEGWETEHSLYE